MVMTSPSLEDVRDSLELGPWLDKLTGLSEKKFHVFEIRAQNGNDSMLAECNLMN
jgi:hypothetical protein